MSGTNIKFSDMTESTLTEFVAYFRDVKTLRTPRKKVISLTKEEMTRIRNL